MGGGWESKTSYRVFCLLLGWWNNLYTKPPQHATYLYNKPAHVPPEPKIKVKKKRMPLTVEGGGSGIGQRKTTDVLCGHHSYTILPPSLGFHILIWDICRRKETKGIVSEHSWEQQPGPEWVVSSGHQRTENAGRQKMAGQSPWTLITGCSRPPGATGRYNWSLRLRSLIKYHQPLTRDHGENLQGDQVCHLGPVAHASGIGKKLTVLPLTQGHSGETSMV